MIKIILGKIKKAFEGVPAIGRIMLGILAIFIVSFIVVNVVTGGWKFTLPVIIVFSIAPGVVYWIFAKAKNLR